MLARIAVIISLALSVNIVARAQACTTTNLVFQSDTVGGQVTLMTNRGIRPATNAQIDLLELRDGDWQSTSKIYAIDHGYFTWLNLAPGKYVLVATFEGYREARVNIEVKRRNGREARVTIPMKSNGCSRAFLRPESR